MRRLGHEKNHDQCNDRPERQHLLQERQAPAQARSHPSTRGARTPAPPIFSDCGVLHCFPHHVRGYRSHTRILPLSLRPNSGLATTQSAQGFTS